MATPYTWQHSPSFGLIWQERSNISSLGARTKELKEKILKKLCTHLNIDFENKMLNWPEGKRVSDGVWAPHWYSEVEKTTGFQVYSYHDVVLDSKWRDIYDRCMVDYEVLNSHSLKVA